jgi:hypothetical protein
LERLSNFSSFSHYERTMLGGALAMALGTFLPIVHVPILGSINYLAGGRGDGVLVLILAAVITAGVIFEYRRAAAVVGMLALAVMFTTLLRMAEVFSKVRGDTVKMGKDNLFGGIASALASSVSFEWGWLPLIGGALAVVLAGLLAPRDLGLGGAESSPPGGGAEASSTAFPAQMQRLTT